MPRRPRIHVDHAFHHATLRGDHRQPVFFADSDRNLLDAIVGRAIQRYEASIHAYCWMSNHLHLLIQVGVTPPGEVGREAVKRRVAPLAEVARLLGKDRSTLRHAMGLLTGPADRD